MIRLSLLIKQPKTAVPFLYFPRVWKFGSFRLSMGRQLGGNGGEERGILFFEEEERRGRSFITKGEPHPSSGTLPRFSEIFEIFSSSFSSSIAYTPLTTSRHSPHKKLESLFSPRFFSRDFPLYKKERREGIEGILVESE